jgi:hypothetical protein
MRILIHDELKPPTKSPHEDAILKLMYERALKEPPRVKSEYEKRVLQSMTHRPKSNHPNDWELLKQWLRRRKSK